MIERELIPFRNTQSPLKQNKGDSKGLSRFGSSFICWYAIIYITSTELLLSTNTLLVLCPFIANMITSGLSYGYMIPLASRSEKMISSSPDQWYFAIGRHTWTLLACLCYAFRKDLYDPPLIGPPVIILISPATSFGQSHSSSLWLSPYLSFDLNQDW